MFVILIRDNQVASVWSEATYPKAISKAARICQREGVKEPFHEIKTELEAEGQYIPDKHPEWSVAIVGND